MATFFTDLSARPIRTRLDGRYSRLSSADSSGSTTIAFCPTKVAFSSGSLTNSDAPSVSPTRYTLGPSRSPTYPRPSFVRATSVHVASAAAASSA